MRPSNRGILLAACLAPFPSLSLRAQQLRVFTHADTLHGSNTPERAWWDAEFYDLHVSVHPADSSITGWNGISYRVLAPATVMEIDLQVPLELDSVVQDRRRLDFRRDANAFFVTFAA